MENDLDGIRNLTMTQLVFDKVSQMVDEFMTMEEEVLDRADKFMLLRQKHVQLAVGAAAGAVEMNRGPKCTKSRFRRQ